MATTIIGFGIALKFEKFYFRLNKETFAVSNKGYKTFSEAQSKLKEGEEVVTPTELCEAFRDSDKLSVLQEISTWHKHIKKHPNYE